MDMIDDQPHVLRSPTRSIMELQTIATAGKFGEKSAHTCMSGVQTAHNCILHHTPGPGAKEWTNSP